MITLFLVISLIALVILIVFAFRKESEGLGYVAVFVGVTVLILGGSDAILWCNVSTGHIIAEKIAMYEEENEEIESSIETAVLSFMDYEKSTFVELKDDDDMISLVSLFPELKSDTLVQQQINVYLANNDQIKQLKAEQINLSRDKWLLYFGK